MMRIDYRFLGLVLAVSGLALTSCGGGDDDTLPGVPGVPGGGAGSGGTTKLEWPPLVKSVAEACGIDVDCKAGGLAEGNASISGVASVDALFQSVLNFQLKAGNISAGIDAQIAAIKGDFGIAADAKLDAELKAQISANVEGKLTVEAEPAKCQVDAKATLDANARCEGKVDPGMVSVECKGGCEVEASAMAKCDANADLKCTVTAPSVACTGECKGSCDVELKAAASCSGTCTGTCSGACSAYSDSGKAMCAGSCDGMCMGSCETELAASAKCDGTCKGECTVTNPMGGCEGGIHASCEAKADAMVMCEGRCDGEVTPPMASAKCEASVKAEAKMNVECTPPRLAVHYKLKAGVNAEAQAKFVAGVENLKVRLPALLAATANAKLVADAGTGLIADASGAFSDAAKVFGKATTDGDLRVVGGLICASSEVPKIGTVLKSSAAELKASLDAAAGVTGAVGL